MKQLTIFSLILVILLSGTLFSQTNIETPNRDTISPSNLIMTNDNKADRDFNELTDQPVIGTDPETNKSREKGEERVEIPAKTNSKKEVKEEPSSWMVNLGFFYLLPYGNFKTKFSEGVEDESKNLFYRIPFNSWNDPLYVMLNFDWVIDLLPMLKTRIGWGVGFNFAGSGDEDESILVDMDSDLGKDHTSAFYAVYNNYHFPLEINIRIQPFSLLIFDLYSGAGLGGFMGIYTYNELVEKERSSYEEQFEKTFFIFKPYINIFLGVSFEVIEEINEFFLEFRYKIAKNPIITNDFLQPNRSVQFQVAGLMIGLGFRY
ncbi:MAG: hypothetical protein KKH98_07010 [Spirochaetes bacterium]|nr:hypothetical protein [Spirochaetota bacterium]